MPLLQNSVTPVGPAASRMLAVALFVVALSSLPMPSSAQSPSLPVLPVTPTTFTYPCSGCKTCSNTGCSGCTYVLNGTCSTNAGWCTGCSQCNTTSCGICNGIGFSLGCDNPEWYNDTKQRYEFVTFLFLAFLAVVCVWVIYVMCRRNKQHREQLQQAQEMSAITGNGGLHDGHNPTYAHDPYATHPAADPLHAAPGSRPEAYSYYYTSTAAMSQPPPIVAPSYPAPPPGYPGVPAYGTATATPTAASGVAGAAVGSGPAAGFSAADQLTPLPVSAPASSGSSGFLQRRGSGQQRDHRQSLLSEEQRTANSSSLG